MDDWDDEADVIQRNAKCSPDHVRNARSYVRCLNQQE